jgi:hypothetical protein
VDEPLRRIRETVRDRIQVATTSGYGPRYLHSTGQLHKGGPATGTFLLVTAERGAEIPIPGESYGFGTLQRAQALGDFSALQRRGRPILRVHLDDAPAGLADLARRIAQTRPGAGGAA